ncbi:hypothetical protein HMPREF0102_00753 [Bacteroides sp. 2_1_22]|nr:hypothetical protein HMPREF0102_00753 [Bacteroides sp. 2_1_22]
MFILNINPVDKTIVLFYRSLFLYFCSVRCRTINLEVCI